jgi:hypothetical protein
VKAFVLVALLLAGSGQALAEDAIPQAKAVKAGHATPVRMAPQKPAPGSSGATTPASLPTAVPEQFSPPQEAYASRPPPRLRSRRLVSSGSPKSRLSSRCRF